MRARMLLASLAAAAVTLSGCGFKGLYTASLPGGADLGNHPFTVTLTFDDVLDLVPQSAVKVNDIAVGKVTAISLEGWRAKVKIAVNDSVKLPSNARALVAQTSLLGEKYVSLMQPLGKPAATMLHNGSTITDTRSAYEVEEVLGALSLLLNDGGLQQIRTIAHELNTALHGNESAIRDLVVQLNTFVGTLDGQKDKITTALDNINVLAATLNRQKKILTDALDTFPGALKVLSDERVKLVTLLTSLSHLGSVASNVINATQSDLVTGLKRLDPVLQQLIASGDNFPQALRIAGTFPFPLGTTRSLVRGDYANLALNLNLNLGDTLCGIDDPKLDPGQLLCKVGNKLPASVKDQKLKTNTASSSALTPVIIGSGK